MHTCSKCRPRYRNLPTRFDLYIARRMPFLSPYSIQGGFADQLKRLWKDKMISATCSSSSNVSNVCPTWETQSLDAPQKSGNSLCFRMDDLTDDPAFSGTSEQIKLLCEPFIVGEVQAHIYVHVQLACEDGLHLAFNDNNSVIFLCSVIV